jgi:hypothetical protein
MTASWSTPARSIAAATEAPLWRPWWHSMQTASRPSPSSMSPEGISTSVCATLTSLWQVVQVTTPGCAGSLTTPASEPSSPRKSWKP